MNINATSRVISKIELTIYSFFIFIILSVLITYSALSYGVSVSSVVLPSLKVKELYIKLDKKLILDAKEINVTLSDIKKDDNSITEIPAVHDILRYISSYFQSFVIDKLYINNSIVTFSYKENSKILSDNNITFKSKDLNALAYFKLNNNHINAELKYIKHKPSKITITGKGIVEFNTKTDYADLNITLPDNAKIKAHFKVNNSALAFNAESKEFTKLENIVSLFKLKHNISKWIVDYNSAKKYKLICANGIYDFKNPNKIKNTLSIHAIEKGVKYTFNKKLPPVHSPKVDIYFSKGVLKVVPNNATYNDSHKVEKADITIDFNNKHVILKIDLHANTVLDQKIIDILQAYKIPLPVLQKDGKTNAHVKIIIDLFAKKTKASGEFFIKESDIILDGVKYRIKNAAIRLHNNSLSIDTADISYKDIIKTKVNGSIDLVNLKGDFYLTTRRVSLPVSKDIDIKLVNNAIIKMHFSDKHQSYIFPKTKWKIGKYNATMNSNTIYLLKKFSSNTKIENLKIDIDNIAKININGTIDIANKYAKLDTKISDLFFKSSDLNISSKKEVPVKILYEKESVLIDLASDNIFEINKHKLEVQSTKLYADKKALKLYPTELVYDKNTSSKLSAVYKFDKEITKFSLQNTKIISKEILFIDKKIDVLYRQNSFNIKSLRTRVRLNKNKSINVKVFNISRLSPYSKILQKYDIKAGTANLTFTDKEININVILKKFHPLLSKNGKSLTEYPIVGKYKDEKINLKIAKTLNFLYDKKAHLSAKNLDFNFIEIKNYADFIKGTQKNNTELLVETENSNIIFKDLGRKILLDKLKAKISGNSVNAKAKHKDGVILFKSRENNFTLSGYNLNDTFMNELFKFSTLKNGKLSFTVYGNFDKYSGILKINDTIIKDYTVLNNTLAFFNTIPALVTFSIPGYSNQGLKASEIYSSFDNDNGIITFKESKLTSKELVITAKGTSDLNKETIDLIMQVKTDIGSSAKNIPLVGYIIFGDETISTTVRVHGNLKDPKVENAVAKSVIVAPYNIIKRTITLPFKLFKDIFSNEDNKSE